MSKEQLAAGTPEPACSEPLTPMQQLRGIFMRLDWAEKLREPTRTEKLRAMIGVGLEETADIEMPNNDSPSDVRITGE